MCVKIAKIDNFGCWFFAKYLTCYEPLYTFVFWSYTIVASHTFFCYVFNIDFGTGIGISLVFIVIILALGS